MRQLTSTDDLPSPQTKSVQEDGEVFQEARDGEGFQEALTRI
jgi:hypothetical protein